MRVCFYTHMHHVQSEEYNFVDTQRVSNMDFLVKYLRSKHAVLFRLTNRVVQVRSSCD